MPPAGPSLLSVAVHAGQSISGGAEEGTVCGRGQSERAEWSQESGAAPGSPSCAQGAPAAAAAHTLRGPRGACHLSFPPRVPIPSAGQLAQLTVLAEFRITRPRLPSLGLRTASTTSFSFSPGRAPGTGNRCLTREAQLHFSSRVSTYCRFPPPPTPTPTPTPSRFTPEPQGPRPPLFIPSRR